MLVIYGSFSSKLHKKHFFLIKTLPVNIFFTIPSEEPSQKNCIAAVLVGKHLR